MHPGRRRGPARRKRRPDGNRAVHAIGRWNPSGSSRPLRENYGVWPRLTVPQETHRETIKAHIQVADEHGRLIAELRGMSFKRVDRATLERAIQRSIDHWLYEITWKPLDEEAPAGRVIRSAPGI